MYVRLTVQVIRKMLIETGKYTEENLPKKSAMSKYLNKLGYNLKKSEYYISNIGAKNIELLYSAIRGEWKIENQLHYYLDMVFEEDKNQSFVQNVQKNLNIIRKFCLAILKIFKEKKEFKYEFTEILYKYGL